MLASDRLHEVYCGIPRRHWRERNAVVTQAFIDDSREAGRVLVLAGYVADSETWATFSAEWQEMLNAAQIKVFKMSEIGNFPGEERLRFAGAFYRIIERHLKTCVAVSVDLQGLADAVAAIGATHLSKPYEIAYRALMQLVAQHQNDFHVEPPVDFIFDDHSTAASVVSGFEEFKHFHPDISDRLSRPPRFERDDKFLPLQAADMFAWHVRRHWLQEGSLRTSRP